MATIDDIHAVERLMQTLDENPHLMEAVRSRILTRELLELPQTVASLTERVDQIAEQLAQLTERVDRLTERVDQLTERVDRLTERVDQIAEQLAQLTERVDRLTERVDRLTERVDQIAEQLAQLTERVDRLTERMEAVERGINRLRDDFGEFRADVAVNAALKNAAAIAGVAGLIRTRNVSQDEMMAMTRANNTTGIAGNDLDSFHHADLVMEATDNDGRLHYVTVEVSYTADRRDTRRAIRNAGYITRFTGHPARAVIVAMHTDWEIDEQIASGAVYLYQIPERRSLTE